MLIINEEQVKVLEEKGYRVIPVPPPLNLRVKVRHQQVRIVRNDIHDTCAILDVPLMRT